jgi:hypothetical protein
MVQEAQVIASSTGRRHWSLARYYFCRHAKFELCSHAGFHQVFKRRPRRQAMHGMVRIPSDRN